MENFKGRSWKFERGNLGNCLKTRVALDVAVMLQKVSCLAMENTSSAPVRQRCNKVLRRFVHFTGKIFNFS